MIGWTQGIKSGGKRRTHKVATLLPRGFTASVAPLEAFDTRLCGFVTHHPHYSNFTPDAPSAKLASLYSFFGVYANTFNFLPQTSRQIHLLSCVMFIEKGKSRSECRKMEPEKERQQQEGRQLGLVQELSCVSLTCKWKFRKQVKRKTGSG